MFKDNWKLIIPARLESTRLERKMLQLLKDKPLIAVTIENLLPLIKNGLSICLATDSAEIKKACEHLPIEVQMTDSEITSGSERVWVAAKKSPTKYIMNIQGDEPFLCIKTLERLMKFHEDSSFDISTLAFESNSKSDYLNPNKVKVVFKKNNEAMYFSRSPLPFYRDSESSFLCNLHQGVYAYNYESLKGFCEIPQSYTEKSEKLEQLRALENNYRIGIMKSSFQSEGIDTIEDLELARQKLQKI